MFLRRRNAGQRQGSGLIVALGVLAMLAVMGTTFITLMRVNARLTTVYTEDLRAQMLTAGVANYCLGILRDDLDRTLGKYENRDAPIGGRHWYDQQWTIPGRNTDWWAVKQYRYAVGPSNDIWYVAATDGYEQSGLYTSAAGHTERQQTSFLGENLDWVYVNTNNQLYGNGRLYLAFASPNYNGYDEDADGCVDNYDERSIFGVYYYDAGRFLTQGRKPYLLSGDSLTGCAFLPHGLYWRWTAKMGIPEEAYMNLNAAGNLDLEVDPGRLNDLDGRGLGAYNAHDDDDYHGPGHLGPLAWKGYAGEYISRFPKYYNTVQYSPFQQDPFRLLSSTYHNPSTTGAADASPEGPEVPPDRGRKMVPEWVRSRWGEDGRPADGSDRWRVGWRRDGATYYRIPSPDYPMGDDNYFGAVEALNHQSEDIAPGTSRILRAVWNASQDMNVTRADFGRMRSLMSSFGCDTILRGKIWPREGPPYTSVEGDWRHIDILKRVNINIIGASGPEGLPNEDAALKTRWLAKKCGEQVRLYYMLEAMLRWSETPQYEEKAAQFVASLTDLVDRDHEETYFASPRGTAWGLGVEKFPVINEVVVVIGNANRINYDMVRLRVELYNPAENIPWIPDAEETYDIGHYYLRINNSVWRLSELEEYGHTDLGNSKGSVTRIGADGMYGDPNDPTAGRQSWSRFAHLGWSSNWPVEISRADLESGLNVQLWKPLAGDAAAHVPLSPNRVEEINGERCLLVDQTTRLNLVPATKPFTTQSTFTGVYRRFDPMNGILYSCPTTTSDWAERSSILLAPGWNLVNGATLGAPNVNYPKNASRYPPSQWDGTSRSPYDYERRFERNFKIVDGDLPSVGWLAEIIMHNQARNGPITFVHQWPQWPVRPSGYPSDYASDLEKIKLDIHTPFGKTHNLHLFDMFTVWDPSNDGIDNDGDGAVDDDDTGNQAGDKLGPEVRVYGVYDVNHIGDRHAAAIMPGHLKGRTWQGRGPNRERGIATTPGEDWHATGPRESIGDLLRIDDITWRPGGPLGGFPYGIRNGYRPYVGGSWNSADRDYGQGVFNFDAAAARYINDDDQDGITDERDERDFFFTQMSNYLTTRSHAMTVEVVSQVTEKPYYPDKKFPRKTCRVDTVFGQRHLVLLVDRSTTLRINEDRTCDFTGPIRILARRWSHVRN